MNWEDHIMYILDLDAWDWRLRPGLDSPSPTRVTIQIPTKNRPIPLQGVLSALLGQSYTKWDLIIVDESDEPEWRKRRSPTALLLEVMARSGHRIRAFHCHSLGIPKSYDLALTETETELALREEDDHVWEADYLKRLVDTYDLLNKDDELKDYRGVGAVAGMSLSPSGRLDGPTIRNPQVFRNWFYYGEGMHNQIGLIPDDDQRTPIISDCIAHRVDVLHGMWLYNVHALREAGGFSKLLGPLGHREETEASLRLSWMGYSLWVCPSAVAYHLEASGGSRIRNQGKWRHLKAVDERRFQGWLRERGEEGCPIPVDLHPDRMR